LGPSCQRKAPHIYSSEEIANLMRKARCLPRRLHAAAISTVIGLLASTGMRVSEALRLQVEDVGWKERLIVVRESKFHKSRLIPLHPTVVAKLATYDRQQRRDFPFRTSFFVSKRGGSLSYGTVQRAFRELVKNLQSRGERARPRLHDLRHTFACRMLTRWSKRPVILDQRVLWLMHYLGHTHVNHTYWYLSAVPELLAQAAVHFERHSEGSTS
jgi:integrase